MVVQVVRTLWTEASRGAPAAAIRNAVPEAVPLPLDALPPAPGEMLWHDVVQDEARAFRPRGTLRRTPIGRKNVGAAEVIVEPAGLCIDLHGIRRLVVSQGALGRLVFNYFEDARVCGWSQRVYRKICINVSAGLPLAWDLFERAPPAHEARCLTDLEGHGRPRLGAL